MPNMIEVRVWVDLWPGWVTPVLYTSRPGFPVTPGCKRFTFTIWLPELSDATEITVDQSVPVDAD